MGKIILQLFDKGSRQMMIPPGQEASVLLAGAAADRGFRTNEINAENR